MSEVKIPSNSRVVVSELADSQTFKAEGIAKAIIDFSNYGIVPFPAGTTTLNGKNFVLGTVGDTKISVGLIVGDENGGVAYTYEGNRIPILANTLWQTTTCTPPIGWPTNDPYGQTLKQISGNYNIDLVATNGNNYIYIDYIQVVDTSKTIIDKEPVPNVWYVNYVDGYKIYVTPGLGAPTPTSLYLGFITAAGGTITAVDETGRTYCRTRPEAVAVNTVASDLTDKTVTYNSGSTYSLNEHIKSVGIGLLSSSNPHATSAEDLGIFPDSNVSTHQQYFHSAGLIDASTTATTSALYPTPTLSVTSVNIAKLVNEHVCIKSVTYSAVSTLIHHKTSGNVTTTFGADYNSGSLSSLSDGNYLFYIDATSPTSPVLTYAAYSTAITANTNYYVIAYYAISSGQVQVMFDMRLFGTNRPVNLVGIWARGARQVMGSLCYEFYSDSLMYYNGTTWRCIDKEYYIAGQIGTGAQQVIAHHLTLPSPADYPEVILISLTSAGTAWISAPADYQNVYITTSAPGVTYNVYVKKMAAPYVPHP
jgi:hypothetical protein